MYGKCKQQEGPKNAKQDFPPFPLYLKIYKKDCQKPCYDKSNKNSHIIYNLLPSFFAIINFFISRVLRPFLFVNNKKY